jgi:hypothetical protein
MSDSRRDFLTKAGALIGAGIAGLPSIAAADETEGFNPDVLTNMLRYFEEFNSIDKTTQRGILLCIEVCNNFFVHIIEEERLTKEQSIALWFLVKAQGGKDEDYIDQLAKIYNIDLEKPIPKQKLPDTSDIDGLFSLSKKLATTRKS